MEETVGSNRGKRSRQDSGTSLSGLNTIENNTLSLNLNPSLMTERQQLAFLLRQTAPLPNASPTSSHGSTTSLSNKKNHGNQKENKVIIQKKKKSHSLQDLISLSGNIIKKNCGTDKRPRGRPPKHRNSVPHLPANSKSYIPSSSSILTTPRLIRKCHSNIQLTDKRLRSNNDSASLCKEANKIMKKKNMKLHNSNNSSRRNGDNDMNRNKIAEKQPETTDLVDTNYILCVLCGSNSSNSPDILFLCGKCDKQYPTQKSLDLMKETT